MNKALQFLGIADDLTGASDLALTLTEQGMASTLQLGITDDFTPPETPALVVALKTRTCSPEKAVNTSCAVAAAGLGFGVEQVFFKVCSTFDSTAEGNIGPVSDALRTLLKEELVIVCPAFPDNGRTVLNGCLFVNGVPLAESPMRNHPLTPMRRSDLVTMMDEQTTLGATGLVPLAMVRQGAGAVDARLTELKGEGRRFAIADAVSNDDLLTLGRAAQNRRLLTGASGLALGLPANFGFIPGNHNEAQAKLPRLAGFPVVVAGSCSEATRGQVARFGEASERINVDPVALAQNAESLETLSEKARAAWQKGPVLISSSGSRESVRQAQELLGIAAAADVVEHALAHIAGRLARAGAGKFIVAGGETSGAVARELGATRLRTGARIAPGVPWMVRDGNTPQLLAFKSGNFGGEDFFHEALDLLP